MSARFTHPRILDVCSRLLLGLVRKMGISLVVAGEHRWLCRNELALIDRLGISASVVWADWVDRETLPAFYSLAEVLLLPSLYDSVGLPILEAMASGCPVITANRYGTKELAGDAALFVNPEEVESIAEGMRRIIQDAPLKRQLVEAGKKRASQFSWKRCAQETMRTLDAVCRTVTQAIRQPMKILGISDHFTSGAAVVIDGRVVASRQRRAVGAQKDGDGFPAQIHR